MGTKSKTALAAGFLGAVAVAATAFGQSAPPSDGSSPRPRATSPEQRQERRAARTERRDERRCGRPASDRARRLVHSESKVKAPSGFALITIDQGEITSIDSSAKKLTVKRLDGESVTVTASDETRVCKDGQQSTFASLKVGDRARLMRIRSERFTGLRRIMAVTPGSDSSGTPASPADFSEEDFGDLSA
jgi:hypothetical protein